MCVGLGKPRVEADGLVVILDSLLVLTQLCVVGKATVVVGRSGVLGVEADGLVVILELVVGKWNHLSIEFRQPSH